MKSLSLNTAFTNNYQNDLILDRLDRICLNLERLTEILLSEMRSSSLTERMQAEISQTHLEATAAVRRNSKIEN